MIWLQLVYGYVLKRFVLSENKYLVKVMGPSSSCHAQSILFIPQTHSLPFSTYPPDALGLLSFLHHLTAPPKYTPGAFIKLLPRPSPNPLSFGLHVLAEGPPH